MNNYRELDIYLKDFTQRVNIIYNSINQREEAVKKGVDILTYYAKEHNKRNDIKIKEIILNEACLVLFSTATELLLNLANKVNSMNIYEENENEVFQIFSSYAVDERFFNLSDIKRNLSIYGSTDVIFYEDLANRFCNTGALCALKRIYYGFIDKNENEGLHYIMDYINTNYSYIQTRLGQITIKVS